MSSIVLNWKKYPFYYDAYRDKGTWTQGIYVMIDSEGVPLYIGSATGKDGFGKRYTGHHLIDNALKGTGKAICFAKLSKEICLDVECQLIQENPQVSNIRREKPRQYFELINTGDSPDVQQTLIGNE